MRWLLVVFIATAVAACPKSWQYYSQCSSPWGNEPLGTSTTNTICSAGCAMTSTAMALATLGIEINGEKANPQNLNQWLNTYGGYEDQDLLIWNSVCQLGSTTKMCLYDFTQIINSTAITNFLKKCMPMVANVRQGTHWVLITGTTSNPDVFTVNDPGFNQDTYTVSDMSNLVVYEVPEESSCHAWRRYLQCNSTYGDNELGTAKGDTICTDGCAMSSVSMVLATLSIPVSGNEANPGNLNKWLTNNNGYADGDLIIWNSVSALGNSTSISLYLDTPNITLQALTNYVNACMPVVVNVRDGSHWVLITGTSPDASVFFVNDPYFSVATYEFSGMSNFVVYKVNRSGKGKDDGSLSTARQSKPANLEIASIIEEYMKMNQPVEPPHLVH